MLYFSNYAGIPFVLCLAMPKWASPIRVSLSIPSEIDEAVDQREARRAFGRSARYTLEYEAVLPTAYDVTRFRIGLQRWKSVIASTGEGDPVTITNQLPHFILCPMWPDQAELSHPCGAGARSLRKTAVNPARYGTLWVIVNDALDTWEILQVSSVTDDLVNLGAGTSRAWPAGTFLYPLILGRFDPRPELTATSDETAECRISIKETSGYAARLNPLGGPVPTVGNQIPDFATYKLFNYPCSFVKPLDRTELHALYDQIGFLRTEQIYLNNRADVRRGIELEFYGGPARERIADIERFFIDRRGRVKLFFVPSWRDDMRLAADLPLPGAPNVIPIEPSEFIDPGRIAWPSDPYIALIDESTNAVDPHKITLARVTPERRGPEPPEPEPQQPPAGELHTLANITVAHKTDATRISNLMLVRFGEDKLEWSYMSDGKATTRLKFLEQISEYVEPQPDLPEPVFLYAFQEDLPTPIIWRFTSYENSVVFQGHTYLPAPFSHASLKTNLKLDQETVELRSFAFDGNPLQKFLPFSLETRLALEIREVDMNNLNAPGRIVFKGDVFDVEADGRQLKANCIQFGRYLERQFPNHFFQKTCNYAIYSPLPRCGVNKNAFRISGLLSLVSETTLRFISTDGHGKEVNYFAGGFIEVGTGVNFERRSVMTSAPYDPDQVELKINRRLLKNGTGRTINAYPGCNGSISTCRDRFNNLSRFGGFAYMPNTNPSIKAMEAKTPSGGKK